MNRFFLMHYIKFTSCIQLKNQKIKMLNVSSAVENYPKINEEEFALSVSAVLCRHTWTVPQQRTQSISFTLIKIIQTEIVFA